MIVAEYREISVLAETVTEAFNTLIAKRNENGDEAPELGEVKFYRAVQIAVKLVVCD